MICRGQNGCTVLTGASQGLSGRRNARGKGCNERCASKTKGNATEKEARHQIVAVGWTNGSVCTASSACLSYDSALQGRACVRACSLLFVTCWGGFTIVAFAEAFHYSLCYLQLSSCLFVQYLQITVGDTISTAMLSSALAGSQSIYYYYNYSVARWYIPCS